MTTPNFRELRNLIEGILEGRVVETRWPGSAWVRSDSPPNRLISHVTENFFSNDPNKQEVRLQPPGYNFFLPVFEKDGKPVVASIEATMEAALQTQWRSKFMGLRRVCIYQAELDPEDFTNLRVCSACEFPEVVLPSLLPPAP